MAKVYFKGEVVFLYTQFVDSNGNPCAVDEPKVRILHDNEGDIYEDLEWTLMEKMSESEYFYNFTIPYVADFGQYQIIYSGLIDGKEAYTIETFHIISQSDKYEDTVKVYGFVHDARTNVKISDAAVFVINSETSEKVAQSLTNDEGYWEVHLYPGVYYFKFMKMDFTPTEINVEIGDEHNELQFNNIGLEMEGASQKGNGIFQVKDKYVTKQGTPLNGLNVQISSIFNPAVVIAKDTTDDDGQWTCYLDPGVYFLKLSGKSFDTDFDKTFRIKVNDNGTFKFEDLSKNIASVQTKNTNAGTGSGPQEVTDYVRDKIGNPIINVQVNAFKEGSQLLESNILAQDYTNLQGKWTLHLEPGNYVIEYYHPDFNNVTEKRTV